MTNNPLSPLEILKVAVKQLGDQKRNQKELLKSGVQNAPVPDDVLDQLKWMGAWDEHEIMSHHPGYDLNRNIESLQRSLDTYRRCHEDLLTGLNEFDIASQAPTLFERPQANELKQNEIACRKEVFALSGAAGALVDIARHVTEKINIPDFNEMRTKSFNSGQHVFIKELRNNLNHITFLETDWAIKYVGQTQTSHFEFKQAKLLRDGDFNEEARRYIEKQKKSIDVRQLFESYYEGVNFFYAWLIPEIESKLPTEVKDYRRCIKVSRANSARCWYRILFSQVVKPETDLYSHLHNYLTPEELAEISALPHRSTEQVDRIIEMVDEYGACDDDLRISIYRAFNVELER